MAAEIHTELRPGQRAKPAAPKRSSEKSRAPEHADHSPPGASSSDAAVAPAAKIQAPLMYHHAELDDRVNASWPAFEAALKEAGRDYVAYMYEGANHGFHNDTTPRFDEAAAALAWERTLVHFKQHLAG